MVETPRLQAKQGWCNVVACGITGWAHTKSDLKVHLVWIPKYRKAVLTGEVALRGRDLLRQTAAEHEREIVSGKVARDHVHLLLSYRPNQDVSQMVQGLKGISSRVLQEFPHLPRSSGDGTCGREVIWR
jgi:putative transposase